MYKFIGLTKRKPGLTMEQFRDHYENVHALLAHEVAGQFCTDYRRNYVLDNSPAATGLPSFGNAGLDFDCITEFWFKDLPSVKEFFAYMARPKIAEICRNDEVQFQDSAAARLFVCEEVPDRFSLKDRPTKNLLAGLK